MTASWDPSKQTATDVSITATVASPRVALASPFSRAVRSVRLSCSRGSPDHHIDIGVHGVLVWSMVAGETCAVEPAVGEDVTSADLVAKDDLVAQ